MNQPGTESFSPPRSNEKTAIVLIGIALALYLVLRILSWMNTSLLESRDSMSMIRDAKVFLSLDLSQLINLPPDTTPIYPLMNAIFSVPGWSMENAARFCSLFFSIVVFVSLAGIGRRLASSQTVILSLLLLAINPVMIGLSKSVLTEPAYIGLVYLGLWIFYRHHENPTWKSGALLGGIFALTFLTRTEGLLYLVAIPVLQFVLTIFFRTTKNKLRVYAGWALAFVISFAALSLPQIWRVSHKMGLFAINGRQVWEVILNNPDGKSYDEKIYGLDYNPRQINIEYIQNHPEIVKSMASSVSIAGVAQKTMANVKEFFSRKLAALVGPVGMAFVALGAFCLWRDRQYANLIWMVGFLGAGLLGPFLHDVDVRHIAVITPMLALWQGIGILYLCRLIAEIGALRRCSRLIMNGVPVGLLLAILMSFATPLHAALLPPRISREYAIDDFTAPLAIVQEARQNSAQTSLKIAGRKGYFAYLANSESAFVPYTDYAGLVEYCRLNQVDMLFLEYDELSEFPFVKNFKARTTPHFELLYAGHSPSHGALELYRLLPMPLDFQVNPHTEAVN